MSFLELPYRLALTGARHVLPLLAREDSKLAKGIQGRREATGRLVAWGRAERDTARPLLWLHAPSVGEGLQARAVLEAVLAREPRLQAVFTHFSPSAEGLARTMPADVTAYLPWDLEAEVGAVLDALRPSALVFTKTEVWPVLVREAERRGVPAALVAATLPEGSSRASPLARRVLRPAYARLSALHAIAEEDAERFGGLGVPPPRRIVTGDPGIDSAAQRLAAADPDARHLAPFGRGRARVVAGSTWPADEEVLVPALTRLRAEVPSLQVVVAPHEPTPEHLRALGARLAAAGWEVRTLAEVEAVGGEAAVPAVLVDRVGVLADLYTVAEAAYVGGGFHGKGLHSVLEPAAAGVPVCFGPRHGNARAAGELVRAEGARVVRDAAELAAALGGWLGDAERGRRAGRAASSYIGRHVGAADRSARAILALMGG